MKIKNIDVYLSVLGIILGIILFGVTNYFQKGIGLSIAFTLSFIIYLLIRKIPDNHELPVYFSSINDARFIKILAIILFILLSLCTFLLYLSINAGQRSYLFFAIVICLITIVSLETLFLADRNNKYITALLLIHIFIIIFSVLLSYALIYPEFSNKAAGDHGYHIHLITQILETGGINTSNVYANYPLMHLFASIGSIITNMSNYNSIIYSFVLFPYTLSLLFVYLTVKRISSTKIALLSTMLTGINIWFIYWGTHSVPMSFSLIFLLPFIYLILMCYNKSIFYQLLILLIAISVLFSHPVASLAMLAIVFSLFTVYLIKKLNLFHVVSKNGNIIGILFVIFIAVSVIFYLTQTGTFFSSKVEAVADTPSFDDTNKILIVSSEKSQIVYELDNMGLYIIYVLTAICVLSYLRSVKSLEFQKMSIYLTTSVFLAISYISFAIGITAIIPHRWQYYAMMVMGYPVMGGILYIKNKFNKYTSIMVFTAMIALIAFFMLVNTTVNHDNPLYGQSYINKEALSSSDISLNNFIDMVLGKKMLMGTVYHPEKTIYSQFDDTYIVIPNDYENYDVTNITVTKLYANGKLNIATSDWTGVIYYHK